MSRAASTSHAVTSMKADVSSCLHAVVPQSGGLDGAVKLKHSSGRVSRSLPHFVSR